MAQTDHETEVASGDEPSAEMPLPTDTKSAAGIHKRSNDQVTLDQVWSGSFCDSDGVYRFDPSMLPGSAGAGGLPRRPIWGRSTQLRIAFVETARIVLDKMRSDERRQDRCACAR
jgi:hypothetical protein